jgi:16S rRNA A1518/A1519 N6-dimethyltransferase RsmA/KsgA/DIM1 with predicted DNA glycosylase/AP lyase activity
MQVRTAALLRHTGPVTEFKVHANLPYIIASELITLLLLLLLLLHLQA